MKKFLFSLLILSFSQVGYGFSHDTYELDRNYRENCTTYSDIYEHMPVLRELSKECSSVVEIGLRTCVSTWGIIKGLSESSAKDRSYLGIDEVMPPIQTMNLLKKLSLGHGMRFDFWEVNDMTVDIPPTDMLFIDSLHTYCHMTYELEKFSHNVRKIICMHDTSEPWGEVNDNAYHGDYSEYPADIDRTKSGLWPAVQDFLTRHPEWVLAERRLNNHGFTVLRRK